MPHRPPRQAHAASTQTPTGLSFTLAQRREMRTLLSQFRRGVVSESASNFHQCAIHVCFSLDPPQVVADAATESEVHEAVPKRDATELTFLAWDEEDSPESVLLSDFHIHEMQHSFGTEGVRLRWCCGSFMLVVTQCITMAVIFWSTLNPSCAVNDPSAGCPTGHWCVRRVDYADAGYCHPCADIHAEFCTNLKRVLPSYDSQAMQSSPCAPAATLLTPRFRLKVAARSVAQSSTASQTQASPTASACNRSDLAMLSSLWCLRCSSPSRFAARSETFSCANLSRRKASPLDQRRAAARCRCSLLFMLCEPSS